MENSFFLPLPESFGFMGWDYYKASVIICVFIVIIIYAVLTLLLIL